MPFKRINSTLVLRKKKYSSPLAFFFFPPQKLKSSRGAGGQPQVSCFSAGRRGAAKLNTPPPRQITRQTRANQSIHGANTETDRWRDAHKERQKGGGGRGGRGLGWGGSILRATWKARYCTAVKARLLLSCDICFLLSEWQLKASPCEGPSALRHRRSDREATILGCVW